MQPTGRDAPAQAVTPDEASKMARYRITKVSIDCFRLGRFSYTTLGDAVAEAQRQQRVEDAR